VNTFFFDSHARGAKEAKARSNIGLAFLMKLHNLIAEDKISSLVLRNCAPASIQNDIVFTITPVRVSFVTQANDNATSGELETLSSKNFPTVSPFKKRPNNMIENSDSEEDDVNPIKIFGTSVLPMSWIA
jgi:hypothetical protein